METMTDREQRVDQIRRAAIPVFASQGFKRTSMADIAEAVGKAAPAAISDNANAPDLSGASKAPLETAAQINLDDLNDSVARTVKSVIREELSSLVQSTVRTTLAELRATHDDKAESHLDDRPSGRPSE